VVISRCKLVLHIKSFSMLGDKIYFWRPPRTMKTDSGLNNCLAVCPEKEKQTLLDDPNGSGIHIL
jgi:hypothetical protein